MQKALNQCAALAARTSVNIAGNAVNLAQGTKIILQSGYVLTIREQDVEVSDEDSIDDRDACLEAQGMAAALSCLLWGVENDAGGSFPYGNFTENLAKVMRCFGIDISRAFTVNGIKYGEML